MASGELRARVAAPPIDGQANRELLALLARQLSVPPSSLRLVQGAGSRQKIVEISGASEEDLRRRLP